LHGVGHPEWIADSEDAYIGKAVALASDLSKLAAVRASLRHEMQVSPLMDEPGFARKIEAAYRDMFAAWVERAGQQEPTAGVPAQRRLSDEQPIQAPP